MGKFFVFRPVFAIVTALMLVLIGAIFGLNLPISQYPQIALPVVQVNAVYPGAGVDVVQRAVAQPIEAQVNGVSGMLYMSSNFSQSGAYQLNITFGLDVDPDVAAIQVQNRVAQAILPQAVLSAGVSTEKQTTNTLMYVALTSPHQTYDALFLSNYASVNIINQLKRIQGVSGVNLFGSDFSMRLWLKPERMAALGITASDVDQAIRQQNLLAPIGQLGKSPAPKDQQFEYALKLEGQLASISDFENVIVVSKDDGAFIRIRDIARVELGEQTYSFQSKLNGKPAAVFAINLSPNASALETSKLLKKKLSTLSHGFPPDLTHEIVLDNTTFVKMSLQEIIKTLILALLLVIIVVFVFLQSWWATLIPVLAIPVSLIATFSAFHLFGFTINTLTLFAMVLAIGLVVDDAIVMVEAVQRKLNQDKVSPKEAVFRALKEVSAPIIATSLVLCAVFVPVAFLGGIAGVMYRQFALTIAASTLFSSFVALSLTPTLCALLLKPHTDQPQTKFGLSWLLLHFNRCFDRLTQSYGTRVAFAIRHSLLSVLLLAVLTGLAALLLIKLPGGFVPEEDQGYFIGSVQLPLGTSMNQTEAASAKVYSILEKQEYIDKKLIINGYNILNGSTQSDSALFVAILKPWHERPASSLDTTMGGVYQESLINLPEASVISLNPPPIPGLGSTGGFSLELQDEIGADPQQLYKTAHAFIEAALKRPEVGNAYTSFNPNSPAYKLILDRDKVESLGVSIQEVITTLQAFLGGVYINDFSLYGQTYQVFMQADTDYRSDLEKLKFFFVRNSQNKMIPLSNLLSSEPTKTASVLSRFNLYPSAHIGGTPAPGYSSGQVIKALEDVAQQILPQGYSYAWSGISLQEKASSGKAPIVFALSFVVVFLFLAALYESWFAPIIILLTVPLAILGSMGGLWFAHLTNNIYSQIGFVLLIGLVAKNAILIVEFALERHRSGLDVVTAAIDAAKLRFRPIVMTTLAFVLGVVPLIISTGPGAAARHAMGTAVFSGILFATPIAVILVPVLFVVITRLAKRLFPPSAEKLEG